ncbi:MAG: hypothetical protein CFE28_12790 [Alphaproteobacteria bacterium PA2]|nr:MAG: hypothetical protein CFE28_12790 [Alphaproteobacteria bacterium PA2]
MTTASRPLATFGLLSLATVALGVFITVSQGAPLALGLRNFGAWGAGALLATGIAAVRWTGLQALVLRLSPVILLLTLFSADMQGVRRWVDLGPVHLNAAMLVLPSAVVALAGLAGKGPWPWGPALVCGAILVAQPDASQVTSLAAASLVIVLLSPGRPAVRAAVVLTGLVLTAMAWTRRDPLPPVPEVEGVISLAFAYSPLLGVVASGLLLAVVVWPLMALRSGEARLGAAALSALLAGWVLTPFVGAYPVPLLGLGMSPILGVWLGVGMLARQARSDTA